MSSKPCFKCGMLKSLSDFYKHPQMGDGHLNKCKVCTRKDSLKTRAARPEYYRNYDRARGSLPHRKALRARIVKEWAAKFPERKNAQQKLRRAVVAGLVDKWPCQLCGESAEAHHTDYDSPLHVVWLCHTHHKQTHAMVREPA